MYGKRAKENSLLFLTICLILATFLLFFNIYRDFFPRALWSYNDKHDVSQLQSQRPVPSGDRFIEQLLHPQDHIFREPTTIDHRWEISTGFRAPDGVNKSVYLINGVFPGPIIEVRSGDTLVVEVVNRLPDDEGVSIHWHGLHLKGANEMDGAVGFTQCPIPPNTSFTYKFTIDDNQAGTFWYHSHSREQIGDGLYGGLVVHKPADFENDDLLYGHDEEILLLIGDWYHHPADELIRKYLHYTSAGAEPVPDSLLLNGIGAFKCSMLASTSPFQCSELDSLPQLRVSKHKRYRLRVINVGSLTGFTFSIPGANINPVQVDGGHKIKSHTSEEIGVLYPGERLDVIVEWAEHQEMSTNILVTLDEENFIIRNLALTPCQSFPISYSPPNSRNHRRRKRAPKTRSSNFDLSAILSSESVSNPIQSEPDQIFVIYTNVIIVSTNDNIPMGRINRTSWKVQDGPKLPLLALNRDQWDVNQFVPWTGSNEPKWVDIVVNNMDVTGHPFHLHGFDFFVVSSCNITYGPTYNPLSSVRPRCGPYNLIDPPQKDTVYVPGRGYVVLRFRADNEGIWAFHCHILWHQAGGMAMAFQVMGSERGVFSADLVRRELASRFCAARGGIEG